MNSLLSRFLQQHGPLRLAAYSIALTAMVVAVALGWRLYAEQRLRESLIQSIQQAGGSTSFRTAQTTDGRILTFLSQVGIRGTERYRDRCELLLNNEVFDDAWMEQHDQLRGLPVSGVIAVRTKLSPDGVCRLAADHRLQVLTVPGIPLTDRHAAELSAQEDLRFLNLNRTHITDAAIPLLQPQQLGSLYVGKTQVTAAGLEPLRDSQRLTALGLDGRQFSGVADELLKTIRHLHRLVLIGAEVTDDHLARVAGMPQIKLLYLERTSVTAEAAQRFRGERPDCQLQMPRPGNEVIPW